MFVLECLYAISSSKDKMHHAQEVFKRSAALLTSKSKKRKRTNVIQQESKNCSNKCNTINSNECIHADTLECEKMEKVFDAHTHTDTKTQPHAASS